MKARPRLEPRLGHIEELQFRKDQEHAAQSRSFTAARWFVVAVVAIVLLLLVREPLSNWLWPDTRAQQLRADAASALAEGRLTSPDGKGARELYEAALALDPDRMDARQGLARVGQAALAQGRDAVVAGHYADAHRSLALAQELAVPRAQTEMLAKELRAREAVDSGGDEWLARAAQARRRWPAGRRRECGPADVPARAHVATQQCAGIGRARGHAGGPAAGRAKESWPAATWPRPRRRYIASSRPIPGHVDLPDALAELARQANRRHRQAAEDLRRGRLPAALEGYRGLLAANPEDSEAERGVSQVADAYAARSEKLASDFRFQEAQAALREAEAIAPDAASVGEARRHMARSRQSQQRYGSSLPPAERQRRLQQMLDDAAAAEARGDLLTPPGDSAYDKLRVARSMAPGDARVQAASSACCPRPSAVSKTNCAATASAVRSACLDAWQVLEGRSAVARRCAAAPGATLDRGRLRAPGCRRTAGGQVRADGGARARSGATGLAEFANRVRAAFRRAPIQSPSAMRAEQHAGVPRRARRPARNAPARCAGRCRASAARARHRRTARSTASAKASASSATSTSSPSRRCMPSTAQAVATTGWPCAMLRLTLPLTPAP